MTIAILCVLAYVLGAIPFGVIVAKSRGVDIMSCGSGNTGATNVWRNIGWKAGLFVLVLDVVKGLVPALAARQVSTSQPIWFAVGVVAVLGHSFSPFLKFKGGKGISTFLGAVIGASPLVAASGFAVFLAVLVATRTVSLSSMIAVASAIAFSVVYRDEAVMPGLFALLTALLVLRHRANIKRLLDGSEPKFFLSGPAKPPPFDQNGGAEVAAVESREEDVDSEPAGAARWKGGADA